MWQGFRDKMRALLDHLLGVPRHNDLFPPVGQPISQPVAPAEQPFQPLIKPVGVGDPDFNQDKSNTSKETFV